MVEYDEISEVSSRNVPDFAMREAFVEYLDVSVSYRLPLYEKAAESATLADSLHFPVTGHPPWILRMIAAVAPQVCTFPVHIWFGAHGRIVSSSSEKILTVTARARRVSL